jgi:hypothetical protein
MMKGRSEAQIRAEMAALQAELAASEQVGVYEDKDRPGHWYVRLKVNGGWTTRRAAPDGTLLLSRDQALEAKGLWRARIERSEVVRGRVLFRDYWPYYVPGSEAGHGPRLVGRPQGARQAAAAAALRRDADGQARRARGAQLA